MSLRLRLAILVAAALLLPLVTLHAGGMARPVAAEPLDVAAADSDHVLDRLVSAEQFRGYADGQAQRAVRCDDLQQLLLQLQLRDTSLVLTDADLGESESTPRLCVFRDNTNGLYSAWVINRRSLEEFRQAKSELQPRIEAAGIDPCQIAFWSPAERAIHELTTGGDWHDAGKRCPPELVVAGAAAEQRTAELQAAVGAAMAKGEELFGWPLTWPLTVFAWSDRAGFLRGAVEQGVGGRLATNTGVAFVSSSQRPVLLLDLSKATEPNELLALVGHEYAHILQHGVSGCTCNLPFFMTEGGAEYFASLLTGRTQGPLWTSYQIAREDSRAGRAVPLVDMVPKSTDGGTAPYTRGYAAMVFLSDVWGADAYVRLHLDTVGGPPERVVEGLERITGLTLDRFDAALTSYLVTKRGNGPLPGPATSLSVDSLLLSLYTIARAGDGSEAQMSRFSSGDTSVFVRYDWDCLDQPLDAEIVLLQPNGRPYSSYRGDAGPGCLYRTRLELRLDEAFGGRSMRSLPGEWRIEVRVGGVLQGNVTFTIGQ